MLSKDLEGSEGPRIFEYFIHSETCIFHSANISEIIGHLTIRSPCDSHDKAVTACALSLQTVVTGLEETLRQWRSIL